MSESTELLDWGVLNPAQTDLLPDQIQRAAQLGQSIRLADRRWQGYRSALGVLGFQRWLGDRAADLTVQIDQASIWQPAYAAVLSEACHVRVGAFKICLVSVGSLVDDTIDVTIAALDLPDFAAHFYVLVQVIEEEEQVAIAGFLTYDQYRRHRSSLNANSDWTYSLAIDWFNQDANALLLNLRCLAPDSIRLPALEVARSSAALREKLVGMQSQLQTQHPSKFLTVDEGLTLLSEPTLITALYGDTPQRSINVGFWLRNQLDSVAQELGWMLMPSLSALRSLRDEFDSIRSGLEQQGVAIPPSARGAYRTLRSPASSQAAPSESVRLYVLTWALPDASEQPEWVLLVALGAEPDAPMPTSLTLEVRDETQPLFEQSIQDVGQRVLYAQVIGNWDEQFRVTVIANETTVFELPPFEFEMGETIH